MPAIGFGTWSLRGWRGRRTIDRALALGYRHSDTAQLYENEADVGRALHSSDVDRGEIFLVTKLRRENLRADAVRRSTDDSLRQLGTDYVDLLLIHWPNGANLHPYLDRWESKCYMPLIPCEVRRPQF